MASGNDEVLHRANVSAASALALAYGTSSLAPSTAEALRSGDPDGLSKLGAPVAVIGHDCDTLRMWDQIPMLTRQVVAADLAHAASQLQLLEDHLVGLCGVWAKPQATFVSGYFAAVREHINTHDERIAARTGALAGLVEPMHWAFAAPLPLPRAHVPFGADPAQTELVDMAFWSRGEIVVCPLRGGTPTPASRARDERLRQTGVRFLTIDRAAIASPATLLGRMGPGFSDFLDGVSLPASPFRGPFLTPPKPAA